MKKSQASKEKHIKSPYKLGLALSGGGARGFAHIGAIKAFEENGFKFDYVAGTSAGSFVGGVYCAGHSSGEMMDFIEDFNDKDILNRTFPLTSSPSYNIEKVADRILQGATFQDLKIPFRAVAVDITSGEEYDFCSGSVAKAISASCAVPIVFKPVIHEDKILVDGGLLNTIPADVVRRMGADFVISVDINSARGEGTDSLKRLDIAVATWRIVMKSTAFRGIMNSDVLITPDLTQFKSTTSKGKEEMINIGYQATMDAMDEIFYSLGIKR